MINGLKPIRTIQSTDRFDAYEAEYKGRRVFAKKAKTEKTKELLTGLSKNTDKVNELGKKTDFKFRAPQIYGQRGDWIVTEWIAGNSMGGQVSINPQKIAEVLASFFIVFDKEPAGLREFRRIFTKDGLANRMHERIHTSLDIEQQKTLLQAKKLFDELHGSLVSAWQDADIKPDHVFSDPKSSGAYVLVDSEHLSPQWPRFFDLANNFAKFWIRDQKNFSDTLVRVFLEKSKIPDQLIFKPLIASIIVRGIALHWEPDYDPGAEHYNIPRAQVMLKACLAANNIDDLLY